MNWNLMLNVVKSKQRILKRNPSSYLLNVGVGEIEFFNFLESALDPQSRFDKSD